MVAIPHSLLQTQRTVSALHPQIHPKNSTHHLPHQSRSLHPLLPQKDIQGPLATLQVANGQRRHTLRAIRRVICRPVPEHSLFVAKSSGRVAAEVHSAAGWSGRRASICPVSGQRDPAVNRAVPDGSSNRHNLPVLGEEGLPPIIQIFLRGAVRADDGDQWLRLWD